MSGDEEERNTDREQRRMTVAHTGRLCGLLGTVDGAAASLLRWAGDECTVAVAS